MQSRTDMVDGVYRRIWSCAAKGRRINAAPALAELLFWRLHFIADDFGHFDADPMYIKFNSCRFRTEMTIENIPQLLADLSPLVKLYSVKGDHFGEIVDWERFQAAPRNGRRMKKYPLPLVSDAPGLFSGNPGESGGIRGSNAPQSQSQSQSHTQSQSKDKLAAAPPKVGVPTIELKAKKPKTPKPTHPEHAPVREHFLAGWKGLYGEDYAFFAAPEKNGAHINAILKSTGENVDKSKRTIDRFFADRSDYIVDHRHQLQFLVTNLSKYIANGRPAAAEPIFREDR